MDSNIASIGDTRVDISYTERVTVNIAESIVVIVYDGVMAIVNYSIDNKTCRKSRLQHQC